MQPETRFKLKVKAALAALPNCWAEKIQQQTIRGTPDFLICIGGYFVALELKRDGRQKPEPLQKRKLDMVRRAGGLAIVAYPSNWPEVLSVLKALAEDSGPC